MVINIIYADKYTKDNKLNLMMISQAYSLYLSSLFIIWNLSIVIQTSSCPASSQKNHLYPLMISTTFVQFQTSTSFPKFSKKLLPPAFNLTCLLILCLPLFNLLIGSFILLKLLFLKFTMIHPSDGSW